MRDILFLNHKEQHCGVYQYGRHLARSLHSERYRFIYAEVDTEHEAEEILGRTTPFATLYNYHPVATRWLTEEHLNRWRGKTHLVSIAHEQACGAFDYFLSPDPDFEATENCFPLGPVLFPKKELKQKVINYGAPVIGSFGLALTHKGFERVVKRVVEEFDQAIIRIHAPNANFVDPSGNSYRLILNNCQKLLKPGITLFMDGNLWDEEELLRWLSENDLNVFLYDEQPGRGVASTITYALSVDRPIAVNDTTMFRHLKPVMSLIDADKNSLRDIWKRGTEPLQFLKNRFSAETFSSRVETIFDGIDSRHNCRVLTDVDRRLFQPLIEEMKQVCPEMMARKFDRANVQQAFVLDQVLHEFSSLDKSSAALCVGAVEDTAAEYLLRKGYSIVCIDPQLNMDLHTFRLAYPVDTTKKFPIIFATSVLEHVEEDVEFLKDIHFLLAPGGLAVLTCDYRWDYEQGDPLPPTDVRLYTQKDLFYLLLPLQEEKRKYMGRKNWNPKPDFSFGGVEYNFCSLVFRKEDISWE